MRVQFGKVTENAPSRFLEALPEAVLACRAARVGGVHGTPGVGRRPHRPATVWRGPAGTSAPAGRIRSGRPAGAPGPRLTASELRLGMRVRHAMFGEGTVTEHAGSTVTVQFPAVGSRRLSLVVAPLEALT